MHRWRTLETRLAIFTLMALAVFAPLETVATWQMFGAAGFAHPGYWGDLVGFLLLLAGPAHSLRARPRPAPALLCAAHAWWAGTAWHSAGLRVRFIDGGGELFYGAPEFWAVIGGAAVAVLVFALSAFLVYQAERSAAA